MSLPSELRNRIYEFALSASTPLYYLEPHKGSKAILHIRTALPHPPHHQAVEFNQLKYANKQLYAETAGLELKFNNITISARWAFNNPAAKLVTWLSSMPPAKIAWINTITLTFDVRPVLYGIVSLQVPETAETIAQLSHLCKSHPTINVKYILPFWQPHQLITKFDTLFFSEAIYYSIVFRGNNLTNTLFPNDPYHQREADKYLSRAQNWRRNIRLEDLQATNLSYMPNGAEQFTGVSKDQVLAPPSILSPESWVGKDFAVKWLREGM